MSAIDYDLKKIKGFAFDVDGVLSPSTIPIGEDGYPRRMVNIKDGFILQLALKKGYKIAIITGGKGIGIVDRFKGLGIKDIFINTLEKLPTLKEWMAKERLKKDEVVYMGDDIPDLPCIQYVDFSAAPFDACEEIKSRATYISRCNGGEGCVRDVIQEVMKSQNLWLSKPSDYIW